MPLSVTLEIALIFLAVCFKMCNPVTIYSYYNINNYTTIVCIIDHIALPSSCCNESVTWRVAINRRIHIDGILPKGLYPPCLRMADRALLAVYPRYICVCKIQDMWKLSPTALVSTSFRQHGFSGPLHKGRIMQILQNLTFFLKEIPAGYNFINIITKLPWYEYFYLVRCS